MGGGHNEIIVDVREQKLATELIEQLERARTSSAGVLRKKLYGLLNALGVDVAHLVGDARKTLTDERKRKAKHASRRRQLAELRLRQANLPHDRELQARRALEAAPRLIRAHKEAIEEIAARPPIPEFDPTFERHFHAPEPVDKVLIRPPDERWTLVKRFNWPIDHIADLLSGQEYEAAEKYLWAYRSRVSQPKIGSYEDTGGQRDPSRRLPLTPTQQRAGLEWEMWSRRLPAALSPILENFVLEIPPKNSEKPLSRIEFGKRYGKCKEPHQARGVADGALKLACGVLAAIWAEYHDWRDTQRANIRAASENEKIRTLIAAGALSEAAREIEAETRTRAARAARGVPPAMALAWLEGEEVRRQVFGKKIEDKRRNRY